MTESATGRNAYWFPLVLFSLLLLISAPFYFDNGWVDPIPEGQALPMLASLGGDYLPHAEGLGWYWLAALPLAYLLIVTFYRRQAVRRGMPPTPRGFVRTCLIGFTIGLLLPLTLGFLAHNAWFTGLDGTAWLVKPVDGIFARGQMPLAVIAFLLLTLASVDRHRRLAIIAAAFALLVIGINVYFAFTVDDVTDVSPYTYLACAMVPVGLLLASGVVALVRNDNTPISSVA